MLRVGVLVLVILTAVASGTGVAPENGNGEIRVIHNSPSEMVRIPSGTFLMGIPSDPKILEYVTSLCTRDYGTLATRLCNDMEFWKSATPSRLIHVDEFYIDRYEVTGEQYGECVRAGYCDVGARLFGDQRYRKKHWPVVNVRWDDADGYCRWRNKRLPSDAEWEKAARGTEGFMFPWGNTWGTGGSNHGRLEDEAVRKIDAHIDRSDFSEGYVSEPEDGSLYAAAAGVMRWGDSVYGVANLAGNVREWVADYYSDKGYGDLPVSNPIRDVPVDISTRRSVRAGSWLIPRVLGVGWYHAGFAENSRLNDVGFRCARSSAGG